MDNLEKYEPIVENEEHGCVFKYDASTIAVRYDIYLGDDVSGPHDHVKICNLLRNINEAGKCSSVLVYLSNLGGSCHGLVSIANALQSCEAPVIVDVTAPCYSAGATLALCGDFLIMEKNTFLMFHNYSAVDTGKGHELELSVDNTREWIHGYFKDLHRPFLTMAECNRIEKDQDVYVREGDKDLTKRIERHFKGGMYEFHTKKDPG